MFTPVLKQKVYGRVFGIGVVTSVWNYSYFTFEVTFNTGDVVAYTEEGIPAWNTNLEKRTIFSISEIEDMDFDTAENTDVLSLKQIVKARYKGKLLAQCPSGEWRNASECPQHIIEGMLERNDYAKFSK